MNPEVLDIVSEGAHEQVSSSANTLLNASFLSDLKNFYKQNEEITCWYTNPTSLNNKISEFLCCISEDKPNLIFITETWWNETSTPFIGGYSLYRRDREKTKGGGVAIYVSNKITSAEVVDNELNNKKEQIWCTIKVENKSLLVGCIYRANMHDDINEANSSIIRAKQLVDSHSHSGLLICGDFNLPTINWNNEGGKVALVINVSFLSMCT